METAIYLRVSTEEQAQEGFSIRAQEQKLKDYARIKDWSIYKIYADEGISGKNLTERPAMQELIADVESGAVENVLVFKIDRLTRNTADLIYLTDLFNKQNCGFNSLTESIDTQSPSGRMFLKIIGIFAEFERENIIERTKVGIERKVREGYKIGGNPSYGYDQAKNQKIQSINEEEAEIVREIFDMYANQRLAINDIARRLNVRKIPTKHNTTWGSTTIRRLLANVNYIGNVRHHMRDEKRGYNVEGQHEAIIDKELFDNAQSLLANNRKANPRKLPRAENYFSGLLTCACCGWKLVTHNSYKTLKDGEKSVTSSYRCSNKYMGVCTTSSISQKKLEKAFMEYISKIPDLDIIDEIEIEEQKKRENEAQIKGYQDRHRQMETKEREAMARYVENELDFESYREIKKMLDKEKAVIKAELAKLEVTTVEAPHINKSDIINNICENWERLTSSERRQFLLENIEKITLNTEKEQGGRFTIVKILDMDFLPSYEHQRTKQPKKYIRTR